MLLSLPRLWAVGSRRLLGSFRPPLEASEAPCPPDRLRPRPRRRRQPAGLGALATAEFLKCADLAAAEAQAEMESARQVFGDLSTEHLVEKNLMVKSRAGEMGNRQFTMM